MREHKWICKYFTGERKWMKRCEQMYLIFREIPYMTDRVSEQRYFLKGVLCVADGAVILNRGEQNLLYIVKT